MISYTCVGTNDVERARGFYDALFSILGAKPIFKSERGFSYGIDPKQPTFMVLKPYDGQPATVGNGNMVTLAAKDKEQVQALHAKALELGGQDEGAPGFRGDRWYLAYFRDLDGNKLAAFAYVKS